MRHKPQEQGDHESGFRYFSLGASGARHSGPGDESLRTVAFWYARWETCDHASGLPVELAPDVL
jgi:hypothetical protein